MLWVPHKVVGYFDVKGLGCTHRWVLRADTRRPRRSLDTLVLGRQAVARSGHTCVVTRSGRAGAFSLDFAAHLGHAATDAVPHIVVKLDVVLREITTGIIDQNTAVGHVIPDCLSNDAMLNNDISAHTNLDAFIRGTLRATRRLIR